ncbi:recombinase family protein [Caballeronia novacaledonica]|uniref:recombinase family protein n=2 Tax=Caballeronia TaxID=1827195 RepID=UPI001EE2A774|nr:recombinase family protein [Caballeronia novacaledonica]GJH14531.1 recombinase family protein [Caballeronia novacaledonica]
MNASLKVQPHHLERSAYLYVRQSSMRQVLENVESTKRQYALRGRATALGWRDEQIVTIDSDQGESGASASWREGFQRLVTDVGMGRAGIVMGLEVSRLARNNADWHRLLEICALADTLILDEDGIYDPASFNDRLLLGLKGTMSEAELHVLKARLRGGILNKVNRGEYRCVLPTGFVYDDLGNVVLDPDSQVRDTITYFFETFLRVGSASQTVKVFKKEGLLFPSRMRNAKFLVFQHLTASTALRMLNNPRYAGAYAYGRRHYRKLADGRKVPRKRERNDWLACIPDAHPGYITWERYEQNLAVLETNGRGYKVARSSPPREGAALLQGRAVCGRCGRYLRLRYATRRGRQEAWYVCDRAQGAHGQPTCQSIAGAPIDEAVGALIVASMTPAAVELAWEIRREIEARHDEADRLRLRAIERARFDADLAQRRFMLVDPSNRLVADTLEQEWNDKLRILADAREQRERSQQQERLILDDAIRDRLIAMTADFKTLWRDPSLANRERKRLLAYIVEDVTLIKLPDEGTTKIHVRFKAGKTETLTAQNPKTSAQQVKTKPEVIELIDKLLDDHTCAQIAQLLNERGIRPGGCVRPGKSNIRFDALRVSYIAQRSGLPSRRVRLRERGMLTKLEAAARLGIHEATLTRWVEYGLVKRHAYNDHAFLYEVPNSYPPVKHSSRWDRLTDRAAAARESAASKTL